MTNPTPSAAAMEAAARLQGYAWRESWDSPGNYDVEASDGADHVLRSDIPAALDAFAREAVERCVTITDDADNDLKIPGFAKVRIIAAIRSAFPAQDVPHAKLESGDGEVGRG